MKKQILLLVALMGAMPAVYSAEGAEQQPGWFASMGNKFNEWTKTSPYLSQSMYGGGGVVVGLSLAAYFANKASKHAKAAQEARAQLAVNPQNKEAQNAFNHHTKWRDIHYSMLAAASSAAVVGGGVLGHGVLSHVRGGKALADVLGDVDGDVDGGYATKQRKLHEKLGGNHVARDFLYRQQVNEDRPLWQRVLNPFATSESRNATMSRAAARLFPRPAPAVDAYDSDDE